MRKSVTLAAILAVSTAFAAGAVVAQETATAETPAPVVPEGGASAVVATVNGTDITLGHMIVLRENLPPQLLALPDETLFQGILDQLVQQAALAQSMSDKITLRDTLAMENDQRGYLSGTALQSVATNAVTEAALQKAYDAQFSKATGDKEYHAAHILVKTEEEAKAIKAQINEGADFGDMAKEHSSDGAAANGGDLGWFSEGMMVAPFQDAVFAMDVDSVSDPVETQFGWHLIQLKETRIKAAPTLDEVREDLATTVEQAAVTDHIKSIMDAATVERPGEGFDPALLRSDTLLD
ncbi:peptidylprolyl isomerase [Pseudorhodobacter turbinis]|uniref:Parvulin-like PPIase n=1 Tax=Pseudorhodobacter turbinis TaxID=2500533 RepID=A0A4P8EG88_9RHOB|nr:peptidylprolyl isomerase [Pseudorhodobacter turbinis]QCO56161.1 peptidylprolyl isomerase [Pseudorhodobacter turbinis]